MGDVIYVNFTGDYAGRIIDTEGETIEDSVTTQPIDNSAAEKFFTQKEWEDIKWLLSDFKR